MTDHHECGPSTLGRRYMCPGSRRMERGLPEVDTEWSQMGTKLHLGTKQMCQGEPLTGEFSDEEMELIRRCHQFALDHTDRAWMTERTVQFRGDESFGTADLIAFDDPIVVIDWKFGYETPSDDDLAFQLAAYVVMACHEFNRQRGVGIAFMPRTERECRIEVDDVAGMYLQLLSVIQNTEDPDAPLVPGDHCKFCRAFHYQTCPAVTKKVAELAAYPHPEKLALANLQTLANLLPVVEPAVKKIRAAIKAQLEKEPGSIDGWKLVESAGPRRGDPVVLYQGLGLQIEDFLNCCEPSVRKLAELVDERTLDELTERKPQIKLVRDKRGREA